MSSSLISAVLRVLTEQTADTITDNLGKLHHIKHWSEVNQLGMGWAMTPDGEKFNDSLKKIQ